MTFRLARGDRILDIGCGTGILVRLATERLSGTKQAVGVDLSPAMLAVARTMASGIDWREGDAAALPLHGAEQVDVVVSQQGRQFFPDKPAAVREKRRARAANGRLAVSTWRPDEGFSVLLELSAASNEMSDEARAQTVTAIARDSADLVRRHSGKRGFGYEIGTNVTSRQGRRGFPDPRPAIPDHLTHRPSW